MREQAGVRKRRVELRAARGGAGRGRRASVATGKASTAGAVARWSGGRVGLSALVLALASALAPPHAGAQTVHGRLLEQGTGRPIAAGDLTLLGEDGEAVDRAETDSAGHFTLRSPDPGSFYVRDERIGYRTKADGVLELGEGGEITVDFYLMPQPVELEGVEGTGERTDWIERNQRRFLEGQGFYRRMSAGFGHFITPEELEERPPWTPRDLFKKIPGMAVGVSSMMPGRQRVTLDCVTKGDGRSVTQIQFAVWVDGIRVWQGGVEGWEPADDVDIENIAAVEVYTRPASLPLQYTMSGICGGILIWTK